MGTDAMRAANLCGRSMHDLVASKFTWSDDKGARRVLASSLLANGNFWAAVEHVKPCGARVVWIGHALTGSWREDGERWVSWKLMTEHMGPSADDCPRAIFALVTDFEENPSYGPAWRERVAARLGVPLPGAQLALI